MHLLLSVMMEDISRNITHSAVIWQGSAVCVLELDSTSYFSLQNMSRLEKTHVWTKEADSCTSTVMTLCSLFLTQYFISLIKTQSAGLDAEQGNSETCDPTQSRSNQDRYFDYFQHVNSSSFSSRRTTWIGNHLQALCRYIHTCGVSP